MCSALTFRLFKAVYIFFLFLIINHRLQRYLYK